jgi:hypothetical protein
MPVLLVLNKLKPGADREAYEKWSAEVDKPAALATESTDDWKLLRANSDLAGAELPFDYVEVASINDAEQLKSDLQSDAGADLLRQLSQFCEKPTLILFDQVV